VDALLIALGGLYKRGDGRAVVRTDGGDDSVEYATCRRGCGTGEAAGESGKGAEVEVRGGVRMEKGSKKSALL